MEMTNYICINGRKTELTEEQLSRPLPAPVNGIESDPALSLYAEGKHTVKAAG